jgi:hypothetical protein
MSCSPHTGLKKVRLVGVAELRNEMSFGSKFLTGLKH